MSKRRPKLIPEWRRVLRRAWSVRLLALSTLLSGAEAAVPYLDGVLPIQRGTFALLAFVVTLLAFAARFLAQRSMNDEDEHSGRAQDHCPRTCHLFGDPR